MIASLASADPQFSQEGTEKKGGGRRVGVEGEVTNAGRGWIRLRWKFLTNVLSIFTLYLYKCINITIKQMYKLYIYKCLTFRGLYPTAWLTLQNTGSIQGSEILKACILFGEKRCSGCDSKVCYYIYITKYYILQNIKLRTSKQFLIYINRFVL